MPDLSTMIAEVLTRDTGLRARTLNDPAIVLPFQIIDANDNGCVVSSWADIYEAEGQLDHANFCRRMVMLREAVLSDAEVERVAKAMFLMDEGDREATSKIPAMGWEKIGNVYQQLWRERARAGITALLDGEG